MWTGSAKLEYSTVSRDCNFSNVCSPATTPDGPITLQVLLYLLLLYLVLLPSLPCSLILLVGYRRTLCTTGTDTTVVFLVWMCNLLYFLSLFGYCVANYNVQLDFQRCSHKCFMSATSSCTSYCCQLLCFFCYFMCTLFNFYCSIYWRLWKDQELLLMELATPHNPPGIFITTIERLKNT